MEREKLQAQVTELDEANGKLYAELQEQINLNMDSTGARLELLIETLVSEGILTQVQRLQMELKFHEQIRDSLKHTQEQYRKAKLAHDREQARLKLVGNKPGLFVPGKSHRK